LPDALYEVIGHSDVKRAVSLARKNIDKESHVGCPRPPLSRG
jgi:hypothetical protein